MTIKDNIALVSLRVLHLHTYLLSMNDLHFAFTYENV